MIYSCHSLLYYLSDLTASLQLSFEFRPVKALSGYALLRTCSRVSADDPLLLHGPIAYLMWKSARS